MSSWLNPSSSSFYALIFVTCLATLCLILPARVNCIDNEELGNPPKVDGRDGGDKGMVDPDGGGVKEEKWHMENDGSKREKGEVDMAETMGRKKSKRPNKSKKNKGGGKAMEEKKDNAYFMLSDEHRPCADGPERKRCKETCGSESSQLCRVYQGSNTTFSQSSIEGAAKSSLVWCDCRLDSKVIQAAQVTQFNCVPADQTNSAVCCTACVPNRIATVCNRREDDASKKRWCVCNNNPIGNVMGPSPGTCGVAAII